MRQLFEIVNFTNLKRIVSAETIGENIISVANIYWFINFMNKNIFLMPIVFALVAAAKQGGRKEKKISVKWAMAWLLSQTISLLSSLFFTLSCFMIILPLHLPTKVSSYRHFHVIFFKKETQDVNKTSTKLSRTRNRTNKIIKK